VPAPVSVTDLELTGTYVDGAAGGTITWQVKNLGSTVANDVLVMQHLPRNIAIESMTDSSGGACTERRILNTVLKECRLATMAPGQSWTIIVKAAPSASSAKAAARVMFQGKDSNMANNYALVLMAHDVTSTGSGGVTPPVRPAIDPNARRHNVGARPLPQP
jgi:hypothetical protein